VVDAVSEVLNVREEDIQSPPEFGSNLKIDYILGMAKIGGGVKILLEIDRVLSDENAVSIQLAA